MPYMLVSTQIRLENGPTVVGDADSDAALMKALEATPANRIGNNFVEYVTAWAPRRVLDTLETHSWKVVGFCGIGQTCAWTLHKPPDWST